MKKDYTQEFLNISKGFHELSVRHAEQLKSIKETAEKINDQNILHREENKNFHKNHSTNIEKLSINLKDYQDFIIKELVKNGIKLVFVVVIILAILAGVKQIPIILEFLS